MALQDFGIDPDRMSQGVRRALFKASEEARRRQHECVSVEHVLYGLCVTDWFTFQSLMRGCHVDAAEVLHALEEALDHFPDTPSADPLPDSHAHNAVILASHMARRADRKEIEPCDLFAVLFHEFSHVIGYIFTEPAVLHALDQYVQSWPARQKITDKATVNAHYALPQYLEKFAVNCNLLAREGKIHPVTGREEQLDRMMEVLCHRDRPNSVMVVGEPGVGKTALVETLAWLIEFQPNDVPVRLRSCQIVNVSINAMVAGTTLRGMFEERIQALISEVKTNPHFILFFDEAHTLVGAGSSLGTQADAANILKSVMARGEVRVIGATTFDEFKAFIADDEALARRFRVISVPEPTVDETRSILKQGVVPRLLQNYGVGVSDAALETSLDLSNKYQRHLKLPDKVIGWLDTAAVRAEINQVPVVTPEQIMAVVADAADIPYEMIAKDQQSRIANMEAQLATRVVGQTDAIHAVAESIILNKGPLKENHTRPDGVLLFLGPTGVGKTELAKAVAEFLFGDENKMIRIDMSEYQDGFSSIEKLIGQPRGIVGSERGGLLTNRLKDTPCTVVLLDEIEKAHPNVLNLFLQAFDEGWLTDGRGRRVYLSDAVVILTSNIGAEHFKTLSNPFGFATSKDASLINLTANIWKEYERRLTPEFRNRLDRAILFQPLTCDEVRTIAALHIERIIARAAQSEKIVTVDTAVIEHLATTGYNISYGARFLKRTIDEQLRLPLTRAWTASDHLSVTLVDGAIHISPE